MPATKDEHGRPVIREMSDRELAEETLMWLRLVAEILNSLGQSPMAAAIGLKIPEKV